MSLLVEGSSWILIVAGALFVVIGAVGLVRLPDFYTRLHPAGVTDTLGVGLLLAGMALQAGWSLVAVKLGLIFLFLMLTSPTASHATARAALAADLAPWLGPGEDEGG